MINVERPSFPEHVHQYDRVPVRGSLPVAEWLFLISRATAHHGAPEQITIHEATKSISIEVSRDQRDRCAAWAKALYLQPATVLGTYPGIDPRGPWSDYGSTGLRFGWQITIRCTVDAEPVEEPRCPSCGEPKYLLASGAVGHSGNDRGYNCPGQPAEPVTP